MNNQGADMIQDMQEKRLDMCITLFMAEDAAETLSYYDPEYAEYGCLIQRLEEEIGFIEGELARQGVYSFLSVEVN